jgi:hypothetical protein
MYHGVAKKFSISRPDRTGEQNLTEDQFTLVNRNTQDQLRDLRSSGCYGVLAVADVSGQPARHILNGQALWELVVTDVSG